MFIHGREVTRTYIHIQRATGCLQEAYFLIEVPCLFYYLLLACFARIIYTFNTKDDIKPQNFRTYSEHSVSVHAGWVAKSKVLVPVLTAFLLI